MGAGPLSGSMRDSTGFDFQRQLLRLPRAGMILAFETRRSSARCSSQTYAERGAGLGSLVECPNPLGRLLPSRSASAVDLRAHLVLAGRQAVALGDGVEQEVGPHVALGPRSQLLAADRPAPARSSVPSGQANVERWRAWRRSAGRPATSARRRGAVRSADRGCASRTAPSARSVACRSRSARTRPRSSASVSLRP